MKRKDPFRACETGLFPDIISGAFYFKPLRFKSGSIEGS